MKVIQAESAGFCFGVDRAVRLAEELTASAQQPRMLGRVIHNDHVTARLRERGMRLIDDPAQAEAGDKQEGERKAAPRRRRRHRSKGGGRPAGTQGEG